MNHNASTPYTDLGASATDNCGTPNVSVGGDVVDVNTVGRYVITYDAVDTSGKNATQVTRTVNVVGIAPVIVVPEDITVNSDSGTCGAIVSFEATENVGIPASSITYDIQPGGTFGLGLTTVTATATNTVGTSILTFNVTVIDNQAPTITSPFDITTNVEHM